MVARLPERVDYDGDHPCLRASEVL
jgi:hypothetical protein